MRHPGDLLGTRAEIKNINSVRFVHQAIEYETRRQIKEIEGGGDVALGTRRFDPRDGVTHPMRSKEEAHDYRYFPDPDLLPLTFTQAFVDNIRDSLPELPDEKKGAYTKCYPATSRACLRMRLPGSGGSVAKIFRATFLRGGVQLDPPLTPALGLDGGEYSPGAVGGAATLLAAPPAPISQPRRLRSDRPAPASRSRPRGSDPRRCR